MTSRALTTLRQRSKAYFERWASKGGKLTSYFCHHCETSIETLRPTKSLVGPRGYWDSCTTCTNCGQVSFIKVWPNGRTESKPLPGGEK